MYINPVNSNNKYLKFNNQKTEVPTKPLKPLDNDSVTFSGKKAKKTKRNPLNFILLNIGQKRAQKLEAQARQIKEDAMDARGFSYIGGTIPHSREIITDGFETNGKTKTTSQVYSYEDGMLTCVKLNIVENMETGEENIQQIFKFERGMLSEVYENVTTFPNGTKDFSRKYNADEKGHLHCVYNKIL